MTQMMSQANSDRTYGLDVAKMGMSQANADRGYGMDMAKLALEQQNSSRNFEIERLKAIRNSLTTGSQQSNLQGVKTQSSQYMSIAKTLEGRAKNATDPNQAAQLQAKADEAQAVATAIVNSGRVLSEPEINAIKTGLNTTPAQPTKAEAKKTFDLQQAGNLMERGVNFNAWVGNPANKLRDLLATGEPIRINYADYDAIQKAANPSKLNWQRFNPLIPANSVEQAKEILKVLQNAERNGKLKFN